MAHSTFIRLLLFTVILLFFCVGQGKIVQLDTEAAGTLCNVSCNFFDPLIWQLGVVPEAEDDVLILYTAGDIGSITLNIDQAIALNNVDVEGNVALYLNASTFSANNMKLIGADYTSEIQINNSTVAIKHLVANNADFLCSYSYATLGYLLVTNVSSLNLVASQMYCGSCHLSDTTVDAASTFTADETTLWSPHSNFYGVTNITTAIIESRAIFYTYTAAYISNISVEVNADVFANGILEIDQITLLESSMIVISNATTVDLAPFATTFIGEGSFLFTKVQHFTFGNPYATLDLTSCEFQIYAGNNGTFTNVIFGTLIVNAPDSVVQLNLNDVTFTQQTNIIGNITANGLVIVKSLSVVGSVICTGGLSSLSGQFSANQLEQDGGQVELSGHLTSTEETIFYANLTFVTASSSRITGDILFYNSTIQLYQPLSIFGDWSSDSYSQIVLDSLEWGMPPRLNVSGDLFLNSTITFSMTQTPSTRTEYPLFTYGGILRGYLEANFTTPTTPHGIFTLDYQDGEINLVYTPHKKSFFSSGPPFYGTIAAVVVVVILVIVGAVFAIRRFFVKSRRNYEVIPS